MSKMAEEGMVVPPQPLAAIPMVAPAGIPGYEKLANKLGEINPVLSIDEVTSEHGNKKSDKKTNEMMKDETDMPTPTMPDEDSFGVLSGDERSPGDKPVITPTPVTNRENAPPRVNQFSIHANSEKGNSGCLNPGSEDDDRSDLVPARGDVEEMDAEGSDEEKRSLTSNGAGSSAVSTSSQPYPVIHPMIIFFTVLSILGGIFSLGTDVNAVLRNYKHFEESPEYLILGLIFLVLAGIISAIFNASWYCVEMKDKKNCRRPKYEHVYDCPNQQTSCKPWLRKICRIGRFLASCVTLGHTCRQVDAIGYAILNRRAAKKCPCKKVNYTKSDHELDTAASLGAFEVFLEAVPTFVIQVSVILMEGQITTDKILSTVSSAVLLPYSIVKYNEATQSYKDGIKICPGLICRKATQTLWKFFEIVPRMVALAAFASVCGGWKLGLFVSINSIFMIIWVMCFQYRSDKDNRRIDPSKRIANLRLIIIALGWNICFLNAQTGSTRNNKLGYYIWVGLQNCGMALWYFYATNEEVWWRSAILIFVIGSTVFMVTFMLAFYKCCHPKKESIKTCLPRRYWCALCYDDAEERDPSQDSKSTKSMPVDEVDANTSV